MDLWDVTKLLWRRWYVTAPLLLVTALSAMWITASVGPEHQATGHVAVLPSEVQRHASEDEDSRINPWNEEALAHAAQIRLEAKRLEDELAAEGYDAQWGVEVTGRLPVVTIEVVAATEDQAVATLHRLQEVVEEEVADHQAGHQLPAGEQITTNRYDSGESVETTISRLRRALVAVVGAGLVLTVGSVIAFEALARWRRSRRQDRKPDRTGAGAEAAGAADQPIAGMPTMGIPAAGGGETAAPDEPRRRYAYASGNGGTGAPTGAEEPPIPIKMRRPADPVSPAPGAPVSPAPPGDDSTIVLPLSNAPWAGKGAAERQPAGGRQPDDWPPPTADQHEPDPARRR